MPKPIQINQGDRYNQLTIINEIDKHISPCGLMQRQVLCRCDCGNTTTVRLSNIRNGHTTSCGCNTIKANTTHGLYSHPLHSAWSSMKNRCYNPNNKDYNRYGKRGIKVCDTWIDNFQQFYDDMYPTWREGLTLDRKNNDGNYCKDNCRWATMWQQNNNRPGYNVVYEVQNKTSKE